MDNLIAQPDQEEEEQAPPFPPELDYSNWSSLIPNIIGTHTTKVETIVNENRRARTLDLDIEDLQKRGRLDEDETIIPVRVIDTNINAELPPYIRYLITPPRVAIFKDTNEPAASFADAETAFSSFVKYPDWIIPIYRVIDGTKLNGIDAIELCACDKSERTPGGFEFHSIGDDCLVLPEDTINIQDSPIVGIKLDITILKLEDFKKNERFNPIALDELLRTIKSANSTAKLELTPIYKFFFKVEGVVYTAYYSPKYTQGWLADPMKLDMGVTAAKTITQATIDPVTGLTQFSESVVFESVNETEYPIYVLRHRLKEEKALRACLGRGKLDLASQDGQTILFSSFVNGTSRATNVSASPDGEVEPGTSLEMLDITYEHGRIWSIPLKYHQPPYPPMDILRGVNAIDIRQKADMGQQSAAADNRVDSRKTAKEIEHTAMTENELNSVSVTIFASWWTSILNACWRIVRSKAIQGELQFCPDKPDYLQRSFTLIPAGDSDYLQKKEREENFGKIWPMLVNFPQVAAVVLADMLKELFPDKGHYYAQLLMQSVQQNSNNMQSVAQGLLMMIEELLKNPAVSASPEGQQIIPKIQELKQALGQQGQQPQQQTQPSA